MYYYRFWQEPVLPVSSCVYRQGLCNYISPYLAHARSGDTADVSHVTVCDVIFHCNNDSCKISGWLAGGDVSIIRIKNIPACFLGSAQTNNAALIKDIKRYFSFINQV